MTLQVTNLMLIGVGELEVVKEVVVNLVDFAVPVCSLGLDDVLDDEKQTKG